MKYFVSFLLVISFVGMGIFSAMLFEHSMHISGNNCVASSIDGKVCLMSVTAMVFHHISAVQSLMTNLPPISNWFLLLVSLLLIAVSPFTFYKNLLLSKLVFAAQRIWSISFNHLRSRKKIISWFALFELSPALI